MHYNTQQPRLSATTPPNEFGETRTIELGQSSSWGEAEFFARVLGYRVSIATWNGVSYRESQYLTPEDYQ